MKKIYKFLAFSLFISSLSFSQVGIGTATPSGKAILDLTATDKGFLMPRMTAVERAAISPAAADKGLQVYETDTNSIWMWNGTTWQQQGIRNIYDSNGSISSDRTVTLGTKTLAFTGFSANGFSVGPNVALQTFSVNGSTQRVGIGTNAPSAKLDVNGAARIRTVSSTVAINESVLTADASGNVNKRFINDIRNQGVALNQVVTAPLGSLITGSFINNSCTDPTIGIYFTINSILNYNGTFTSLNTSV